jgi:hypothetical protein
MNFFHASPAGCSSPSDSRPESPKGKGDILLIRVWRNICRVFGFCTTYRPRQTSIRGVGPGAQDCGLGIERGWPGTTSNAGPCKTKPIARCRLASRGESCETNPIWPRRRRLTEEIVRNEAKLGWTGVYGQLPIVVRGVARPGSETCKTNPIGRGQMHKTNPISPRRRWLTEEIVQNEAKLRQDGTSGGRRARERAMAQNKANFLQSAICRNRSSADGPFIRATACSGAGSRRARRCPRRPRRPGTAG